MKHKTQPNLPNVTYLEVRNHHIPNIREHRSRLLNKDAMPRIPEKMIRRPSPLAPDARLGCPFLIMRNARLLLQMRSRRTDWDIVRRCIVDIERLIGFMAVSSSTAPREVLHTDFGAEVVD